MSGGNALLCWLQDGTSQVGKISDLEYVVKFRSSEEAARDAGPDDSKRVVLVSTVSNQIESIEDTKRHHRGHTHLLRPKFSKAGIFTYHAR